MLYAILCYNDEDVTTAWSKAHDDEVMAKLGAVQARLAREGRLGPVARLMPTTAATTLRKDREPPLILDGPFAETKEQLLGFYIVDCDSLDGALDIDFANSPFTNSVITHRLPLHVGHTADIQVICVDVETLALTKMTQRYTRTGTHTWSYTSLATGAESAATVDEHGFVIDEEGGFRRADGD